MQLFVAVALSKRNSENTFSVQTSLANMQDYTHHSEVWILNSFSKVRNEICWSYLFNLRLIVVYPGIPKERERHGQPIFVVIFTNCKI
jgi:hypothetical protein